MAVKLGLFPLTLTASLLAGAAVSPAQAQDLIQSSEFQVTFDSGTHDTPIIGKDAIGEYIVYSQYSTGNASIYYQRIANGAPFGLPVAVANAPTTANYWLPAASGDYIAYTASPFPQARGNIALYSISTGQSVTLTTGNNSWFPSISGDNLAWVQGTAASSQAMKYQISSGGPTTVLGGPNPSVSQVSVGDRFIVWSQNINPPTNTYSNLAAYDLQKNTSSVLLNDPSVYLSAPSTAGAWVAFQVSTTAPNVATITDIDLLNVDTGQLRTIASNGFENLRPDISGDWISYESNVGGNYQIFAYDILNGETFQITNTSFDERLNDLFCDSPTSCLVTYIDTRNGNAGVFASDFTLIPVETATPLPASLPLLASGLGGLGLLGWRRKKKAQVA